MSIQQIKANLSILTLLNHYGLNPNKNKMLHCPFHSDKKASMKVYADTHTVYCFAGSCKVDSLDVIDFIMKMEKGTKHEAIKKAKALCGATISNNLFTKSKPITKKMSKQSQFTKYVKSLEIHQVAKLYLEKRGLDYKQIEVGYKSRKTKEAWGKGCIIFPLKNETEEIVSFYGRSIFSGGHYYESGRTGLYPSYPRSTTDRLILAESIIDVASLVQLQCTNNYALLSLFGTNGLTGEHKKAIEKLKELEEIILIFDGDEAGRTATMEQAKTLSLLCKGVKISQVNLPEGEDVNNLFVNHDDKEGLFSELLENRKLVIEKTSKVVKSKLDTANPNNLIFTTSLATYYIKGGIRYGTNDFDHMKITLVIENALGKKSRQKVDLFEDKQVEKVSRIAGEKLNLRADLIELDIQILTDELETYRAEKQREDNDKGGNKVEVPTSVKMQCLEFLSKPNLLQRINILIGKVGIVGEDNNRLLLFIVASSYKMFNTLHALIQGSSGSGKTRLLRTICSLMPPENVSRYTRVTDSAFYNQPENFFVHRLIGFEDLDGLKEDAAYAARELMNGDELRSSISIKDQHGRITGGEKIVKGPIASLACTTKGSIYEDNINRSFVIAVDESKEQTLRIIDYQNRMAAGEIDKKEIAKIKAFIQNCIRLLQPYEVVNPFAKKIKLPQDADHLRRLNELYQSFVEQVTLLNQFQRKKDKQGRLITQKEDLKTACDILFESMVLRVDDLKDGSLRQFFEKLKSYVKKKGDNYKFTRRELRLNFRISKTQILRYLNALQQLEYISQHGFGNRGYTYKISFWDDNIGLRERIKNNLNNQLEQL